MRLTDIELIRLMGALLALVLASQVLGGQFQRWQQPRVIGEILGGVLVGPMVLGAIAPDAFEFLFRPDAAGLKPLAFAIWLGQLLLMFASGQESHEIGSGGEWRAIAWLTGLGMLVPMGAGWLAATCLDLTAFIGPRATPASFALIVAMATAITAIPVIARILLDLDLVATPFARVVLAVAFIEDMALWALLALALGLGRQAGHAPWELATSAIATAGFFFGCLGFGHRLYDAFARSRAWPLASAHPATGPVVVLLVLVLGAAALGINPVFGGFLAGRVVARARSVSDDTREQLKGLAFGLFIPVFFAGVGLRIDMRAGFDAWAFLACLAFAVGVKMAATVLAGRLAGKAFWPTVHLGVALNARGAMGVVLATLAFDAQLITASFYTILVLVALVTSQFAGWWLQRVKSRWPQELELSPVASAPAVPART